jgi:hypothetical protein
MNLPTIILLTESELNLDNLLAQITLPTTGASAIFAGVVRAQTSRGDNRETISLDYEAYQPMAEAKMRQVAEEIRQNWPTIQGIAIQPIAIPAFLMQRIMGLTGSKRSSRSGRRKLGRKEKSGWMAITILNLENEPLFLY